MKFLILFLALNGPVAAFCEEDCTDYLSHEVIVLSGSEKAAQGLYNKCVMDQLDKEFKRLDYEDAHRPIVINVESPRAEEPKPLHCVSHRDVFDNVVTDCK